MKKQYLYFHAGSGNHGCEAIVRSTVALLGRAPVLISSEPQEDRQYAIDQITDLSEKPVFKLSFCEKVGCWVTSKILKSEKFGYEMKARHEAKEFESGSVALSIGGDNYCYGEAYNLYLAGLNKELHKRNVKTVLWGCSIEPDHITDAVGRDFARYDLIVARESISCETLKKYNSNVMLACDPAFCLELEKLPLPPAFIEGKTIGINLSPLIQRYEQIPGITMSNYEALIRYIIYNTDYSVALIPHVVWAENDDREPLRKLYAMFAHTGRICLIDDCNCKQLKGYISRCAMFAGARTHAVIAAYSTGVPALTLGYSNKANGIATDIFGTAENFVMPVQRLKNRDDMVNAFVWLEHRKTKVKNQLLSEMPSYIATIYDTVDAVRAL